MRLLATLLLILVACGDDPPPNKPTAPAATGAPAPAANGAPGAPGVGSGKPLPTLRHAEDRVYCEPPKEGSKRCDPTAIKPDDPKAEDLTCTEPEFCQNTTQGYLCGPCPERFAIRRVLKDSDYTGDANRDPFQSFVIKVPGSGSGSAGELPKEPGSKCVSNDQLRVGNYGYQDLKLVGIVSQGTQRKVLMMDPGNYGHIIKKGDCVGKEKAWVKDIGDNFICFEMSVEAAQANRLPDGQCVELHNKQLTVTQLPQSTTDTPKSTPVLPSTVSPQPVAPTGPTTTIVPARPPSSVLVPAPSTQPSQPPTVLKP